MFLAEGQTMKTQEYQVRQVDNSSTKTHFLNSKKNRFQNRVKFQLPFLPVTFYMLSDFQIFKQNFEVRHHQE